jgi:hypothetical protein
VSWVAVADWVVNIDADMYPAYGLRLLPLVVPTTVTDPVVGAVYSHHNVRLVLDPVSPGSLVAWVISAAPEDQVDPGVGAGSNGSAFTTSSLPPPVMIVNVPVSVPVVVLCPRRTQ